MVLLKIRGSHLTRKVSNKCLNDRESTKMVEKEQKWPIPSSASPSLPLSFSVFVKETMIKKSVNLLSLLLILSKVNTALSVLIYQFSFFKGALTGLRQFLATVSLLKMIKNAFHFTIKALLMLKILKFLS